MNELRESDDEENGETERSKERNAEEESYVPVIVKRSEETRRHPDDMLEKAVDDGCEQLVRPFTSLVLSSVAAGLILGFTVLAVGVASTAIALPEQPLLKRMLVAVFYPVGFIMCIMSGSQLFTEHTATAVYPVLERKEPITRLPARWKFLPV